MVSKGQFVGLDWNRIARLHSQVLTNTLPDFIRWGPGYKSVYYGINNTRPVYSERAH